VLLVPHALAHTGSIRPAVCTGGAVPLPTLQPSLNDSLLLALQRSANIVFILPEHAVHGFARGWHCHATSVCAVNDPWVRGGEDSWLAASLSTA
jgi:hypothetical protein